MSSLAALPSWTSAAGMGWSSAGSLICTAGCCSPLIIAILWRTTHATMMSHALSGVILSFCRHWNRDLSIPMVVSTRALVLQWATLKCCRGPRLRVRGQQRGLAWIATIPQQVAIKLSCNYRGHIWVHLKRETTNFVQGFSFLTTCKSVAQTTLPVDPGVMDRARPLGFNIGNDVSCITNDLYSAENDMS